jgi:hypothetical protein
MTPEGDSAEGEIKSRGSPRKPINRSRIPRPASRRPPYRSLARRKAAHRRPADRPLFEDLTPIRFAELLDREFGGFIPPALGASA